MLDSRNKGTQNRNSSIEVLRIIAILMIICSHFSVHSGFDINAILPNSFFNTVFLQFFVQGNLGVDIFVMISGYFMIGTGFSIKKFVRLIIQVWTYSVLIYCGLLAAGVIEFSINDLIRSVFPTCFQLYWFFSVFALLFLLSPAIDQVIKILDDKNFDYIMCVMTFFIAAVPFITSALSVFYSDMPSVSLFNNEFIQLVYVYLLGAWLKRKKSSINNGLSMGAVITAVSFSLLLVITIAGDSYIMAKGGDVSSLSFLYGRTSIITIACALGLMLIFINLPVWSNRIVNTISSCVFGIYLFHDNPFMRDLLWVRTFHNAEYALSDTLIIRMVLEAVLIFSIGVIIELLRKRTIDVLAMRLYEAIGNRSK